MERSDTMTEDPQQQEEPTTQPLTEDTDLITKPRTSTISTGKLSNKKKPMTDEQKMAFLERMKKARETKKNKKENEPTLSVRPKIIINEEQTKSQDNQAEILELLRQMKHHYELKKSYDESPIIEPPKRKRQPRIKQQEDDDEEVIAVKPKDIYSHRVNELKKNYVMSQVAKDLFG